MLLTSLVLVAYVAVAVVGARYSQRAGVHFFTRDQTTILRGLCAVIVIFAHYPLEFSNVIQDLVSSFAYVSVTLFFMFSAFGLEWSVAHKNDYLRHFLRNRVLVVAIPYAIMYAVRAACGFSTASGGTGFVLVLLLFYFVFYLAHRLLDRRGEHIPDLVVCAVVLAYSLTGIFSESGLPWHVEALGFLYGLVLARSRAIFVARVDAHYAHTVLASLAASVVLGVLYVQNKEIGSLGVYLLRAGLDTAMVSLLLAVTMRVRLGNAVNRYLGSISYEVFLTHGFIISLAVSSGLRLSSGGFTLFVVTGTIALASVLFRVDTWIVTRVRRSLPKTGESEQQGA